MSKPKRDRSLPDNEAKAIARMLRVSPQKLNLVAQLIRGRKAASPRSPTCSFRASASLLTSRSAWNRQSPTPKTTTTSRLTI